jgi:isopentenyl-diphosphate delta-isomerase
MPSPTKTTPIDVVDESDTPIGMVERGEALRRGVNFRTAHIFVFDRFGNLLLQRLAAQRDRHPCRWGSSVAAYLYAGETYEEAAARRLREELGLDLTLRFVGKLEMRDNRSLKFVSLFLGHDGMPEIFEPAHIDELAYWPQHEIEGALDAQPAIFTPTFRSLYEAFGDRFR